MKFVLLINLKLPTISNSVLLNITEYEIFSANKYENANYSWHFHIYQQRKFTEHEIFSASKYENAKYSWHFHIYQQKKFHAQLS